MKNDFVIDVEHYLEYYSMLFEVPLAEIKDFVIQEDGRIKNETSIVPTGKVCSLVVNNHAFTGEIRIDLLSIVNVVGRYVLDRISTRMKNNNVLPVEIGAFSGGFYRRFTITSLSFLTASGEKSILFEPICEDLFKDRKSVV